MIECTDADYPYNNLVFFQTHDDQAQPNVRYIRLGHTLQKVTEAHDKHNRIMPAGGSDYYVFFGSTIILKIVNEKVASRAIYYHT